MIKPAFSGGCEVTFEGVCSKQVEIKYRLLERISELQMIMRHIYDIRQMEKHDTSIMLKLDFAKEELDIQLRIMDMLNQNEIEQGYKFLVIADVMNL